MKKILVPIALMFFALASCTNDVAGLTDNESFELVQKYENVQAETLRKIYKVCLQCYSEELSARFGELKETESFEKMLEVVRYCDMLDTSGDFMPELDGYDEIAELLWPNGYGNDF